MGRALALTAAWFLLFLPAANPWIGVLVDEPYTLVAAGRVVAGEVPYRDFFFLWTPGVIYLHAALHALTNEWLYSGRAFLVLLGLFLIYRGHKAADAAGISSRGKVAIWCLALVWGLPQWNQPYASWYAIALLLWAAPDLGRRSLWSGVIVAGAFWFKQNIGLYGLLAALLYLGVRERHGLGKFVSGWVLGIVPGAAYFWLEGGLSALLKQTLLFPWTYREVMAFPLSDVAFFHVTHGLFFVCTLIAFPFAVWRWRSTQVSREWERYLLMAGAGFLQLYPRFDFTHFVFSFVCALVPLVWVIDLGRGWWRKAGYAVLLLLFTTGAWESGARLEEIWRGKEVYGLRGRGFIHAYLSEMREVKKYLEERGLKAGDPVLQVPVTTAFYFFSGFKNATPHNQFFPAYVESYGESQDEVLNKYLARGGRYVVLDRNAKAKEYVPRLMGVLEQDFYELHRFPLSFSVWAPRSMLRR